MMENYEKIKIAGYCPICGHVNTVIMLASEPVYFLLAGDGHPIGEAFVCNDCRPEREES